jgi:hypothetical protein
VEKSSLILELNLKVSRGQNLPDPSEGSGPMADLIFNLRLQLGHGFLITFHNKNRIVAKSAFSLLFKSNTPFTDPLRRFDLTFGRGNGNYADEPG